MTAWKGEVAVVIFNMQIAKDAGTDMGSWYEKLTENGNVRAEKTKQGECMNVFKMGPASSVIVPFGCVAIPIPLSAGRASADAAGTVEGKAGKSKNVVSGGDNRKDGKEFCAMLWLPMLSDTDSTADKKVLTCVYSRLLGAPGADQCPCQCQCQC